VRANEKWRTHTEMPALVGSTGHVTVPSRQPFEVMYQRGETVRIIWRGSIIGLGGLNVAKSDLKRCPCQIRT
jgi:hypothetical protein